MIAGYLWDVTGSYRLAFSGGVLTSVVALLLFLATPKPPPYADPSRLSAGKGEDQEEDHQWHQ